MSSIERATTLTLLLLGGATACASAPAAPLAKSTPAPRVASPSASPSPSAQPSPLETRLSKLREQHRAIGACAALVDVDAPTRLACSGVRRNDQPDVLQATDRFHLGSDTKAMTATLAAALVEQGLIRWDTTLGEFPDLKMHKSMRAVTLLDLLSHRSGITGSLEGPLEDLLNELHARTDDLPSQRRWLAARVLALQPEKPPRTAFIYSNLGYVIAGTMLEKVTKQPWEALIEARIFQPLGMTSCGFGAPNSKGPEPYGHLPGEHGPEPVAPGPGADNPAALGPAGTVHCNLEDWGRFVNAHLIGETGRAPILSAESYVRLHTPPPYATPVDRPDYALGWIVVVNPKTGGRALTHAGSNTMFYAEAWLFPENGRAYLVGLNDGSDAASAAANAIILDLFDQVPPRGPRPSGPASAKAESSAKAAP